MNEKIATIEKNKTWVFMDFPKGKKSNWFKMVLQDQCWMVCCGCCWAPWITLFLTIESLKVYIIYP